MIAPAPQAAALPQRPVDHRRARRRWRRPRSRPVGRGSVPDLPTADVTRGEFVDTLELRGEIRPLKSIVLSSPMQSGELQILKLANNGSKVKAGDIVVQFDGTTLRADDPGEAVRAEAGQRRDRAGDRAGAHHERAERHRADEGEVQHRAREARHQQGRDRLAASRTSRPSWRSRDAEQRLKELEEKMRSDKTGAEADLSSKLRKREKAIVRLEARGGRPRTAAAQGADATASSTCCRTIAPAT